MNEKSKQLRWILTQDWQNNFKFPEGERGHFRIFTTGLEFTFPNWKKLVAGRINVCSWKKKKINFQFHKCSHLQERFARILDGSYHFNIIKDTTNIRRGREATSYKHRISKKMKRRGQGIPHTLDNQIWGLDARPSETQRSRMHHRYILNEKLTPFRKELMGSFHYLPTAFTWKKLKIWGEHWKEAMK